jgi:hypothetical protein
MRSIRLFWEQPPLQAAAAHPLQRGGSDRKEATMKARWLGAAALATVMTAGIAMTGCEDPVDITPSDNAVGTTQTTGADISTGAASASDTATINNVHPADDSQNKQQQQSNVQPQAQPQQQAQSYTPVRQTASTAAPADTSGYGTLPMPNAETQVGSYSANTVIQQGGTGSVVTDVSGAPAQNASGSNVNPANAPNAYSTSASNAIRSAGPANAAAVIGAIGTANDVAAADPRSAQSTYNASATQAPVNNQMRTGAYSAAPVQPVRTR